MVNVGKYTIHWASGIYIQQITPGSTGQFAQSAHDFISLGFASLRSRLLQEAWTVDVPWSAVLCQKGTVGRWGLHIASRIHVWYLHLHFVDFYGRCSCIYSIHYHTLYHTWILWHLVHTFKDSKNLWKNGSKYPLGNYSSQLKIWWLQDEFPSRIPPWQVRTVSFMECMLAHLRFALFP